MYLHITLIFVFLSCFTLKLFVIRLLCFLKTGAFRNRSKSDSSRTQLSLQSILSKVGRDGWLPESRFKIKVMFKYGNDCNNQSHLMTECYCSSRSTRDVRARTTLKMDFESILSNKIFLTNISVWVNEGSDRFIPRPLPPQTRLWRKIIA